MAAENSTLKPRIVALPPPAEPQSITAVREAMRDMTELTWDHMVGIATGMLSREEGHDSENVVIHLMRIMSEETRREFLSMALDIDERLAKRRKPPILTTCK